MNMYSMRGSKPLCAHVCEHYAYSVFLYCVFPLFLCNVLTVLPVHCLIVLPYRAAGKDFPGFLGNIPLCWGKHIKRREPPSGRGLNVWKGNRGCARV